MGRYSGERKPTCADHPIHTWTQVYADSEAAPHASAASGDLVTQASFLFVELASLCARTDRLGSLLDVSGKMPKLRQCSLGTPFGEPSWFA
jgi:hypothetical protein